MIAWKNILKQRSNKLIEAVMHDISILQGRVIEDPESWDPNTMEEMKL